MRCPDRTKAIELSFKNFQFCYKVLELLHRIHCRSTLFKNLHHVFSEHYMIMNQLQEMNYSPDCKVVLPCLLHLILLRRSGN